MADVLKKLFLWIGEKNGEIHLCRSHTIVVIHTCPFDNIKDGTISLLHVNKSLAKVPLSFWANTTISYIVINYCGVDKYLHNHSGLVEITSYSLS